ncbi:hypothetical protein [Pyrococcus abyssi]|uniref:Uncharacterized protein n=1 Tax=Pyrococcus abyssi (strain GE5 / Orsay) TaxID=272844 RepID=Q9UXW2_PYRAB|nr:hypothetical protein [Pyrococcus abyssi]CAB50651.1 Hypothetical protein PAB1198 [Pyrococcus abyssi GE5]CCE71220.1 TPA: hypothetical protein PAB1198 [Pyrococcus abyssi GE5]
MGLKDALKYPPIFVGFLLLLFALFSSLLAIKPVVKVENVSGNLTPGEHIIEGKDVVTVFTGNLTLSSENATVSVKHGTRVEHYILRNSTVVLRNLTEFPRVSTDGNVKYKLSVMGYAYPYSWISPISFVAMIIGNFLAIAGFASYLTKMRENIKKKKAKEETGDRDVQGTPRREGRF